VDFRIMAATNRDLAEAVAPSVPPPAAWAFIVVCSTKRSSGFDLLTSRRPIEAHRLRKLILDSRTIEHAGSRRN